MVEEKTRILWFLPLMQMCFESNPAKANSQSQGDCEVAEKCPYSLFSVSSFAQRTFSEK